MSAPIAVTLKNASTASPTHITVNLVLMIGPPSEVELSSEFEQAPAHDLDRLEPLVPVPRGHIEEGARVEQVEHIDIPANLCVPHLEQPAETDVHLSEAIFEERVGWDQVDRDIGGTRADAAALRQIAAERRQNLRVVVRSARRDRDPWNILVDRAGLELPRQRVDDQQFDLRRGGPWPADVAEVGPRVQRRQREGVARGRPGHDTRRGIHHEAVVGHGAPGAQAARELPTLPESRLERYVDAVEDFGLVTEVR